MAHVSTDVLHTTVLDTLGRRITSGELPEGTVLTLDGISREFSVSRTVAREVMRLLEGYGLLRSRRRVGLVVLPIADWQVLSPTVIGWRLHGAGRVGQLRSLTELRHAVEPLAAALAARHAPLEVRSELLAITARMRELGEAGAGNDAEFLTIDVRLHELLLRSGGNELFGALSGVVATVLSGRTALGLMPANPAPGALEAHEAVARAVAAGDADAAFRAMSTIVAEVQEALDDADDDADA
jgi:DNA-binding FadR family transcriptional regulator